MQTSNESGTVTVAVEYTDTFGGEANYSWVERVNLTFPSGVSDRAVMRAAKAAMGLTGVRGRRADYGDTLEFRPYGEATVLFVSFTY